MKQVFYKLSAILLLGTLISVFSLSWFFSVSQSRLLNRQQQSHLSESFSLIYRHITSSIKKNNNIPISKLQKIISLYSKKPTGLKNNSPKDFDDKKKSIFLMEESGRIRAHSEPIYYGKFFPKSSPVFSLIEKQPKGWNTILNKGSLISISKPITISSKKYFLILKQKGWQSKYLFLSYLKWTLLFSFLLFSFLLVTVVFSFKSFTQAAHFLFSIFSSNFPKQTTKPKIFLNKIIESYILWPIKNIVFLKNPFKKTPTKKQTNIFNQKNRFEPSKSAFFSEMVFFKHSKLDFNKKVLSYLAHTQNTYLKNMRHSLNKIFRPKQTKDKPQGITFLDLVKKATKRSQNIYPHLKIEQQLKSNIKLPVCGDLLYQSIWELIKNAAQATQTKKQSSLDQKQKVLNICTFKKDGWFCCELTDNGHGVDNQTIEKMSELYFTKNDQSTGLGLTFVQNIFNRIGGIIKFFSPKEGGLKVSLFIPLNYIFYMQKLKTSTIQTKKQEQTVEI